MGGNEEFLGLCRQSHVWVCGLQMHHAHHEGAVELHFDSSSLLVIVADLRGKARWVEHYLEKKKVH